MKNQSIIFDESVDQLMTLISESTRSTTEGVKRFLEPSKGILSKAKSKRHHIIFGRRGTGKSSLLQKTATDLSNEGNIAIYIDVESLNENEYPDILLQILLQILKEIRKTLKNRSIIEKDSILKSFLKYFTKHNTNGHAFLSTLNQHISELENQLRLTDQSHLEIKSVSKNSEKSSSEIKSSLKSKNIGSLEAKLSGSESNEQSIEEKDTFKRSKLSYLNKNIISFTEILDETVRLTNKDAYILIDDLYHIHKDYQASLLGFLHKIAKNHRVWLKIWNEPLKLETPG